MAPDPAGSTPLSPHTRSSSSRTTDDELLTLARSLVPPPGSPTSPRLVAVLAPDDEDRPSGGRDGATPTAPAGAAHRHLLLELPPADPVAALVTLTAPEEWVAVGTVTGARTRSLDDDAAPSPAAFVHLQHRDGHAVSVLRPSDGGPPFECRPGTDPSVGRLADVCRRMLGLPTAPPPCDMTPYLVEVWLALVARAATVEPGLGWDAVVALHPAAPTSASATNPLVRGASPTPAEMAHRTTEFGAALDWDRFRSGCAAAGGSPLGELDRDALRWMDAGMFSRWVLGELLPWPTLVEILDAVLAPAAADRLYATLALCPTAPWPP